jgi:hypothetical protein
VLDFLSEPCRRGAKAKTPRKQKHTIFKHHLPVRAHHSSLRSISASSNPLSSHQYFALRARMATSVRRSHLVFFLLASSTLHLICDGARVVPLKQLPTHSLVEAPFANGTDWPTPDPAEFPDYYKATPIQFTVRAGDILYFPREWWHWVFTEGSPAISFNVWTEKPHRKYKKPTLLEGAASHWPALTKWNLDFLESSGRKKQLEEGMRGCRHDGNSAFYPEELSNGTVRSIDTMRAFAQEISHRQESQDHRICFSCISIAKGSSILKDVELPKGIHKDEQQLHHNMWISHGAVQTGWLHEEFHLEHSAILA